MKSHCILLSIFLLVVSSCNKSPKMIYPRGSGYTYLMCGPHNFHHVTSGYTYMTNLPFSYADTVVLTIDFIDSVTVSCKSLTLAYDTTSNGDTLKFSFENVTGHPQGEEITFNRLANSIYINYYNHVSAGGGTVYETFRSL